MNCKIQYYENVSSPLTDTQIKCKYYISTYFLVQFDEVGSKFDTETQNIKKTMTFFKKKEKEDLSYTQQNNVKLEQYKADTVVLAQRWTNRSMEQNGVSNKPKHANIYI